MRREYVAEFNLGGSVKQLNVMRDTRSTAAGADHGAFTLAIDSMTLKVDGLAGAM